MLHTKHSVSGLINIQLTTPTLQGTIVEKAGDGSSVTEVRLVVTRPQRALQLAIMATSIISETKAIKIWRIHSGHPHLDLAGTDEYGAVMDLRGCGDCRGCNKAEVMLWNIVPLWLRKCRSTFTDALEIDTKTSRADQSDFHSCANTACEIYDLKIHPKSLLIPQ